MKNINLMFMFWFILQTILLCKIRTVKGIVGGKPAERNQFKYTVSVQADGQHVCGGAIISEEHIITAAHCVIDEENKFINKKFSILAQIIDLMVESTAPIEELVHAIFVPQEYQHKPRNNRNIFYEEWGDLAILKLKNKLSLGNGLTALELPKRDHKQYITKFVNMVAVLTGYGTNNPPQRGIKRDHDNVEVSRRYDIQLQFVEATVQHKRTCNADLPITISDKHLVARVNQDNIDAVEGQGACFGDDGSPLVFNGDTLIGVLAQHWPHCNEKKVGSVYTRITTYIRYIKNVMRGLCGVDGRLAMYKQSRTNPQEEIWEFEELKCT